MSATTVVVAMVVLVIIGIAHRVKRLEKRMDQERQALDALVVKLDEHFVTVTAALDKIIALAADVDVDNSAEIGEIAARVNASTEAIKAVLNPDPPVDPPVDTTGDDPVDPV